MVGLVDGVGGCDDGSGGGIHSLVFIVGILSFLFFSTHLIRRESGKHYLIFTVSYILVVLKIWTATRCCLRTNRRYATSRDDRLTRVNF